MSDVAAHDRVRRDYPALAEALELSASPQLRNMASIGGNLMQKTRCPYFRAEVELPCNKRRPGSGCSAIEGNDRGMAVFGWSVHCIATHPSDAAVALTAMDAIIEVRGPGQTTARIAAVDFHRLPDGGAVRESILRPGQVITAIEIPASPMTRRSHYLKLRERASYEFALVSAAVGLDLDGDRIRTARIALGGVAHKPWRMTSAEAALAGAPMGDAAALRAAIDPAFGDARPRRHNGFKVELAKRAVVRALQIAGGAA
jgi:xanthine dehydrogenase YagS FAD-binding subunit